MLWAVIEDVGDPDYAAAFGGTYLNPNGSSSDPDLVFRAGSSGVWYSNVNGSVYDSSATEITAAFTANPATPTFGAFNPTVVPEPGSVVLFSIIGLLGLTTRRRK